jgi:hypothetical protein
VVPDYQAPTTFRERVRRVLFILFVYNFHNVLLGGTFVGIIIAPYFPKVRRGKKEGRGERRERRAKQGRGQRAERAVGRGQRGRAEGIGDRSAVWRKPT